MSRGKKWHISAILHDWNSGATSTQIAETYGFSSHRACRDRIAKWRKQGWNFEKRTAGCPKKNRRGQITAMWLDELTDSEATTAGIIRGSESNG